MEICSNLGWKYGALLIGYGALIGNGWFYLKLSSLESKKNHSPIARKWVYMITSIMQNHYNFLLATNAM